VLGVAEAAAAPGVEVGHQDVELHRGGAEVEAVRADAVRADAVRAAAVRVGAEGAAAEELAHRPQQQCCLLQCPR
jgi:hypothetical protein